ncbi:hypothetical protein WN48_00845 [Eufriesea mexicana]|uniref:Uncharacterized protein n=1 Tax=Eufriesea mexicana TaxID=516756 RepID=A0A310SE46_9HYME|nr:hypothetical protein WN48_00845 [Eufriesea mexicana]
MSWLLQSLVEESSGSEGLAQESGARGGLLRAFHRNPSQGFSIPSSEEGEATRDKAASVLCSNWPANGMCDSVKHAYSSSWYLEQTDDEDPLLECHLSSMRLSAARIMGTLEFRPVLTFAVSVGRVIDFIWEWVTH